MNRTPEELSWLIRRHALEMTSISKGSHIASVFSVAEICACLYSSVMKFDCNDPTWSERDRFILSKGHAGAAVYAALAECGFFDRKILKTHYGNGSILSGHVSHKKVPGVDFSTGSLGHGLSVATGMSYSLLKRGSQSKVYVVLGDGECDEGSVWEAALFASHFKLGNLIAIIDHNKMQSLDFCEKTLSLSPLAKKWSTFGWDVVNVEDGNSCAQLLEAFNVLKKRKNDKPKLIIANTIKGKGVSFMEFNILWHYRYPHPEEYTLALNELNAQKPVGLIDPYEEE